MNLLNTFIETFSDAHELLPKTVNQGSLWVGNFTSALNVEFLTKNNINIIINLTKTDPFITENLPFVEKKIRIHVDDDGYFDSGLENYKEMTHSMQLYIPSLAEQLRYKRKNILVHCHAGKQRSNAFSVALLIYLDRKYDIIPSIIFKKEDAEIQIQKMINYVQSKRPQSFTYGYNVRFMKSLKDLFVYEDDSPFFEKIDPIITRVNKKRYHT